MRPRLSLAAQVAFVTLPPPVVVVLKLHLDPAGNVISVEIKRSSGSSDIDQACTIAAYQWWLEPSRDPSGRVIADVVPFVIRFD